MRLECIVIGTSIENYEVYRKQDSLKSDRIHMHYQLVMIMISDFKIGSLSRSFTCSGLGLIWFYRRQHLWRNNQNIIFLHSFIRKARLWYWMFFVGSLKKFKFSEKYLWVSYFSSIFSSLLACSNCYTRF